MRRSPDFIIIGAGKCGTTSLHRYINEHPDIYLCPIKETYFFIEESIRRKRKSFGAISDPKDYYALFENAPEKSVIGEISTNYYAYPASAKIIHDALPHTKIIAILRDPANRAFSSYQMRVRGGHEKREFDSIIAEDNRHVIRGFYYRQLLPYFELFDREQIKILFFEDLCRDSVKFVQDLFEYLGVDTSFVPNTDEKRREGGLPKNQVWHKLLTQKNPIRTSVATILKPFIPLDTRRAMRQKMVKENIYKAKLSPESRQKLITLYRDDILKLQDLIQRDLSSWLR